MQPSEMHHFPFWAIMVRDWLSWYKIFRIFVDYLSSIDWYELGVLELWSSFKEISLELWEKL